MNASPENHPDRPLRSGFCLEELKVDPRAGDLSGPGGRETLDPKVMEVLVVLAQRAGQVVLREDLLREVWPGAVVTDDALTRCVYELRRHLGLAGGDERYKAMLETLPKRGYRLNGRIDAPATPALMPLPDSFAPHPDSHRQHPWKRVVLAMAGAVALAAGVWFAAGRLAHQPPAESTARMPATATHSIAVLPFVDMSEARDQGYLSDGISEEILNRLTRIPDLRVIARTSSFTFRDQQADVREIATKLEVGYVLEGSVRRAGDHVRITAQLIDAASNSHRWSKTYDRALGDLFAVQDEIAASVATALDMSLSDTTSGFPPPDTSAAYQSFLQGEFFFNRRAPGDIERSVKYYESAVSLEPGYARAWAGLSRAYSLLAEVGAVPRSVARAKQGEAAHKAVALAPHVSDGHFKLAQFYFEGGDREAARKELEIANTLGPDDEALSPGATVTASSFDPHLEADIQHHRREIARDPLAATSHVNLGVMLAAVGRLEEAKSALLRAKELSPSYELIDLEIIRVLVLQRAYDEAYSATSRLPEGEARDHGLALLFDAPGRRAEADAALARLVRSHGSDLGGNIRLAEAYAYRGMTEEAISTLQSYRNSIDPGAETFVSELWWMQREMHVSPFLTSLHADPRWSALMAEPA